MMTTGWLVYEVVKDVFAVIGLFSVALILNERIARRLERRIWEEEARMLEQREEWHGEMTERKP